MNEDLYSDGEGSAPERQPSSSNTATINKSVVGKDVKPGDTLKLKVVAVHGQELEVECEDCESSPDNESDEPMPQQGGGDMRSMLED